MRAFIISTSLVLALAQVGPGGGADDNITALVRGCHVYLGDWVLGANTTDRDAMVICKTSCIGSLF